MAENTVLLGLLVTCVQNSDWMAYFCSVIYYKISLWKGCKVLLINPCMINSIHIDLIYLKFFPPLFFDSSTVSTYFVEGEQNTAPLVNHFGMWDILS